MGRRTGKETVEGGREQLEMWTHELRAVRSRGDQFAQRAREAVEEEALLPEVLEELSTALEELRVSEEEIHRSSMVARG